MPAPACTEGRHRSPAGGAPAKNLSVTCTLMWDVCYAYACPWWLVRLVNLCFWHAGAGLIKPKKLA